MKTSRKLAAALAIFAAGSVFAVSLPAQASGIESDGAKVMVSRHHDEHRGHHPEHCEPHGHRGPHPEHFEPHGHRGHHPEHFRHHRDEPPPPPHHRHHGRRHPEPPCR